MSEYLEMESKLNPAVAQTLFVDAYRQAVDVGGYMLSGYFGSGHFPSEARSLLDLKPDVQGIARDMGLWNRSEMAYVAVLVGYADFAAGQKLVNQIRPALRDPVDALNEMSAAQRSALFNLMRYYQS